MHTGLELSLETHYLGLDYMKYIKVSLTNINLQRSGSCIICIFISSGNYLLPVFVYTSVDFLYFHPDSLSATSIKELIRFY
jgi:hypothetical protein